MKYLLFCITLAYFSCFAAEYTQRTNMINQIKIGGIYRHYKGNNYKVLYLSTNADDLSTWVVYETLYNNPVAQVWHRKLEEFVQVGQWQPGMPAQSRFALLED